jgi:hypothetical protein
VPVGVVVVPLEPVPVDVVEPLESEPDVVDPDPVEEDELAEELEVEPDAAVVWVAAGWLVVAWLLVTEPAAGRTLVTLSTAWVMSRPPGFMAVVVLAGWVVGGKVVLMAAGSVGPGATTSGRVSRGSMTVTAFFVAGRSPAAAVPPWPVVAAAA